MKPLAESVPRDRQFNFRVTEEEARRLELVAGHHGVDASNAVRMLVKKEYDRIKSGEVRPHYVQQPVPARVLGVFLGWVRAGADMSTLASLGEVLEMAEGDLTRNETVRGLNILRDAGCLRRVRRDGEGGYLLTDLGRAAERYFAGSAHKATT